MPNNMSEEYSAIAFYGVASEPERASGFYRLAVDWFQQLGHPPDKVSVHGTGHSGTTSGFTRINSKLQKSGFEGVTAFSIFSMTPGGQIPVTDFLLTATYDSKRSYAFVVANSSLAQLSQTSLLPIAEAVVQTLQPEYGTGYTRERKLGPSMYAIGITQGLGIAPKGELYEESLNISRWGDLGMVNQVYKQGLLRDVYPWNFLTQSHLARKVDSATLAEWIQEDTNRGGLIPIGERVSLWEVKQPELAQVRQFLMKQGLIFDWKTHR